MRLLTHNFLQCVKCSGGFPLAIATAGGPEDVLKVDCDFEPEFIQNLLGRIDYPCLGMAVDQLRVALPSPLPSACESGVLPTEAMRSLHVALNCYEIVNGLLTCPACAQQYLIKDRIPNMVVV